MEQVEIKGYPDGEELIEIASKESVYILEDEVVNNIVLGMFLWCPMHSCFVFWMTCEPLPFNHP